MTNKYPSAFIKQYPRKIAILIDCENGLNSFSLTSRFVDNFPVNSDIFLFYPNDKPGMIRSLKRIEAGNHGIFNFPTSVNGIELNLSFILGQINHIYNDFVLIVDHNPAYEDLCQQLIDHNEALANHIQVRSFERIHEFEQFLKEMTRVQNESDNKRANERHKITLDYSRKHLFHACPYESREESSIVYRFGELLQHLDVQHPQVHYEYCNECQQLVENHNSDDQDVFETHIKEKHWNQNGFNLHLQRFHQ